MRCFDVLGASLALAVACHADPDIVATKMPDGGATSGLGSTPKKQPCQPGRYEGHMNTVVPDGGAVVPFSADINFSLAQNLAGEFYVLQDKSALSGNNENGTHFTAEINGGNGCREGSFSTQLVDGKYWITADSTATPIPFEGTIAGSYTAEFHGFNGTWSTILHLPTFDLPVSGTWSANYAGPIPATMN